MDQAIPVQETAPPVEDSTIPAPEVTATTEEQPVKDAETEPTAQPEKTFTQSELDRILARERAKESRRAERFAYEKARRELAEERLQAHEKPPEQPQASGEPKPDQFQDYEQYVRAVARWEIKESLRGVEEKSKTEREKASQREWATHVHSRISSGAEKYEDFDEVALSKGVPFTDIMIEAMVETEIPADIAYFLGTNRKEAIRIAGLSRAKQALEVDRIAKTLTAPPKPTTAPAPIKPNSATGTVEKRLEEADYDEFVKIRRRQIAARR